MIGFSRPWCIAGGWALDLWLGRVTRPHQDVDIALLREDQIAIKDHFHNWKFYLVDTQGKLRLWKDRQMHMLPTHEIHARGPEGEAIEFLLNESNGIDWLFRRDTRITLPMRSWMRFGAERIPVLAPEIVLLYKSKKPSPKDELDFRSAMELLDPDAKAWLIRALQGIDSAHPWLGQFNP
jgi:hypothetical protein